MTVKFPKCLRDGGRKICGDRAVGIVERMISYVCFEANPIVQIVYFACAGGGFYIYVMYGFIHVPNAYVANYHKYLGTAIMLLCYFTYFMACWVNPGTVTKDNWKVCLKKFKYDNIIF
jgi:palmitoyltransferase